MEKTARRSPRRRAEGETRLGPPVRVAADLRERSVLVVEADPDVQVQLARTLRRQGHRVVGTSSGDGALALVSEWDVDLILVSEDLPGRSGVEVTRMIHRVRPDTRVVVLAALVEPSVCAAARAAGAVGCVEKPLAPHSLLPWLPASPAASVNAALQEREAMAE